MNDLKHVKGLRELGLNLQRFPEELREKALKAGMRAGAKPIADDAKQNVQKRSGQLAAGIRVQTRSKGLVVRATVVTTGPHGHVANWLEHGTAAHELATKKKGGVLSFIAEGAQFFFGSVTHPGAKPYPFMRPALDRNADGAIRAVGATIARWLAKADGRKLSRRAATSAVEVGDAA